MKYRFTLTVNFLFEMDLDDHYLFSQIRFDQVFGCQMHEPEGALICLRMLRPMLLHSKGQMVRDFKGIVSNYSDVGHERHLFDKSSWETGR
jgi:hypothetical protein